MQTECKDPEKVIKVGHSTIQTQSEGIGIRAAVTLCHLVAAGAAGDGAVAVAWPGHQGAAAPDGQRTQVHPQRDGLLLQVGGGRRRGVLPPVARGAAPRRHHCPLWIPAAYSVQAAARLRAPGESDWQLTALFSWE